METELSSRGLSVRRMGRNMRVTKIDDDTYTEILSAAAEAGIVGTRLDAAAATPAAEPAPMAEVAAGPMEAWSEERVQAWRGPLGLGGGRIQKVQC